jgi:YD repeat-containing protein
MMTKMTLLKYLPWLVMLCGLGGNALGQGAAPADPVPSYYQESGISRTREYINQHDAEHIDPFTGKLQYHFVDLFIPGNGGMDLKLTRSYNSLGKVYNDSELEVSSLGIGWSMHFGRMVKPYNPQSPAYVCDLYLPTFELSDGTRRVFYRTLNQSVVEWNSTDFWKAECSPDPYVAMVFSSPDGTKYEVGFNGHINNGSQMTYNVSKIIDKNGNWIKINYQYLPNSISAIKSVMTNDGRGILFDYTYQTSRLASVTEGIVVNRGSVDTVEINVNGPSRKWTYVQVPLALAYNLLREIILPNGEKWKYEYNDTPGLAGHWSMRQVTQPTGGMVDYSYGFVYFVQASGSDRSAVVTQKVATKTDEIPNSPPASPTTETWTYQYIPATERLVTTIDQTTGRSYIYWSCNSALSTNAALDRTIITGPNELRTLGHFGSGSISNGFVYMLGIQACSYQQGQTVLNHIVDIQISDIPVMGPAGTNTFDSKTFAALPAGQIIGRYGEVFDSRHSNFDVFGNPQTITEVGTNTKLTNITYNNIPAKWIIRQKKDETQTEGAETLTTTRTFDANGNMLSEVHAGVPSTYTYHPTGDLASKTDARLKTSQYSNYFRGIARTELQPAGISLPLEPTENVVVSRTVSDSGNVTSETDAEGATTSFSYDGLNRVTGITHPLGNPVTVAWGPNSRTVTRGPYIAETTFDGFGREVKVVHTDTNAYPNVGLNTSIVQNYKVDSLGRRTFASYPNSTMGTKTTYDMLNRTIFIYNEYLPPMNGNLDSWASSRRYSYFNYETQLVDERNVVHTNTNRYYGNPDKGNVMASTTSATTSVIYLGNVAIPQTESTTTQITRNISGQKTSVTLDGVTRSFAYNNNFFLISSTEPETGITLMGRDAVGNLTTRRVGISNVDSAVGSGITTFSYDDRNRLATVTYPKSVPTNPKDATDVVKRYYKDDKLKSVDNGIAKREYAYDSNKNMTAETLTVGLKVFPTVYTYNGNDAHTSIKYGSLKTVTYEPDAFGRPRQAMPYINAIAYHPSGQPSSYTYANGVTSTIGLNDRQWPNTLLVSKYGIGTLFNSTYVYDKAGNVASISDTADSSLNRELGYDFLDRLVMANGPWGGGTISYDTQSNIVNQQLGARNFSYIYDRNTPTKVGTQRLTTVLDIPSYGLRYDVYGNAVYKGENTYFYNDAANLKCAGCGLASEVLYDYDGNNQRVKSTKAGATTYYIYGQGGQLLWEETPTAIPNVTPNGTRKEYIYMGGKQIATREEVLP